MAMKHIVQNTRNAPHSIQCDVKAWYLGGENSIANGTQSFNPTAI
jgi:hypothetical protein